MQAERPAGDVTVVTLGEAAASAIWLEAEQVSAVVRISWASNSGYRFGRLSLGLGIDSLAVALKALLVTQSGPLLATNPWIAYFLSFLTRRQLLFTGTYASPGSRSWGRLRRRLAHATVITPARVEAEAWSREGGRAVSVLYGNDFPYPPPERHQVRDCIHIFVGGTSDRDMDRLARLEQEVLDSGLNVLLTIAVGGLPSFEQVGMAQVRHLARVAPAEFGRHMAEADVVYIPFKDGSRRAAGHMLAVGALQAGCPVVHTRSEAMVEYDDGYFMREIDVTSSQLEQILQAIPTLPSQEATRAYWRERFSRRAYIQRVSESMNRELLPIQINDRAALRLKQGDFPRQESHQLSVLAWPAPTPSDSNPYISNLYGSIRDVRLTASTLLSAMRGRHDIWHIHWPEWAIVPGSPWQAYARTVMLAFALFVRKWRGTRIVWTVHNLKPHRHLSRLRERVLYAVLARFVDHQVHLTEATSIEMANASHACRFTPYTVIPHGLLGDPGAFPPRDVARLNMGIGAKEKLYVFFGGIDEYKGVDRLMQAFQAEVREDARLLVLGRPATGEIADRLSAMSRDDTRIMLDLRFQEMERLYAAIAAADIVVLPYVAGLNSGSVYLALAGRARVLVPSTPTFEAVSEQVGLGWIQTFAGDLTNEVLENALSHALTPLRVPFVPSWDEIGSRTRELYETLARIRGRKVAGLRSSPLEPPRSA